MWYMVGINTVIFVLLMLLIPLAGEILAVTTVCSMGTVFLWVLALSQMGLLAF